MIDRTFTEPDLRTMLADAFHVSPDIEPGRWSVSTRHRGRAWEVILEPDHARQVVVVVTAYRLD